jgi:hypothetical protein
MCSKEAVAMDWDKKGVIKGLNGWSLINSTNLIALYSQMKIRKNQAS